MVSTARDKTGINEPLGSKTPGGFSMSAPASRRHTVRRGSLEGLIPCRSGRKLSIPQILDSFPDEARELIPRHIARLNKIISPYKKWIDGVYQGAYSDFVKWFIVQASVCCGAPVAEIAWLEKLKKMRGVMNYAGENYGMVSAADILKAKYVPITSLVECKRRGGRWVCKCPFHADGQERTPSMIINKENTAKCFSCGFFSDSIGFARKLYGYSFPKAVDYLCQST